MASGRGPCLAIPLFAALVSCPLSCASLGMKPEQESEGSYEARRQAMVKEQLAARDIHDRKVLDAMARVPRHEFVPAPLRRYAYTDRPLPIGLGQTISQPYIVAFMTQTARPKPEDRALEIGTGSGYQAAVLAELVREVYTIEILPELAQRAEEVLQRLGYTSVHVQTGDGYAGWPSQAPFDIILVTAAAERIPQPLLEQLAEGGRLVMPVGRSEGIQTLTLVTKKGGKLEHRRILSVRFVPMTGTIQNPNGVRD